MWDRWIFALISGFFFISFLYGLRYGEMHVRLVSFDRERSPLGYKLAGFVLLLLGGIFGFVAIVGP